MKTGRRTGFRGVRPVVQRELREGSRRPFNHWLRVGSALAGLLLLNAELLAFGQNAPPAAIGVQLFSSLHILLLILICCIVPTMTADCIAREKREGTLGLLFLTGLTPAGIVVGKSMVQSFRAFTLWFAVLPVLTIPFLTGGVGLRSAVFAVTTEFCVAVLCLAAGLLASTLVKARAIAFGLALIFAMVFVVSFSELTPFHLFTALFLAPSWGRTIVPGRMAIRSPSMAPVLSQSLLVTLCIGSSLLIFVIILRIAARHLDHSWRDKIPSKRRASLIKRYCTPLFQNRFSRGMRRALDTNPMAWLQQYSWKARVSKWGLCFAFVALECVMGGGNNLNLDGFRKLQVSLVVVLAVVFTFVGVNSFLEEKKSGALELILISPLTVNQIIFGRAWGLWKQFLPALVIIAGFYIAATITMSGPYRYYGGPDELYMPLGLVLTGYLTLPIFSTYFALRVKNLIVAAVLTWIALLLAPLMGYGAMDQVFWRLGLNDSSFWIFTGVILGDIAFAMLVCFLLRHSLSRRIYSF